jgi:hypothetical protein
MIRRLLDLYERRIGRAQLMSLNLTLLTIRCLGPPDSGYRRINDRRHRYPMDVRGPKGEQMGINRWSDIEERKKNETDAKAGDELAAEDKGAASSRLRSSKEPKENEEKREVLEKFKERKP